ncbi:hypothetical protein BBH88_16925 [Planococcus antarcticus DSM 14505]|uniref:DUF624 domain-containing protein n=1 Tax=Planococcus antarcticus DSM 14505 TaxID=1185653 RepID=A0ABM6D8S7_9BACL|nr:DUF624 domain-containing protein [Planococcus antarcticus]ANU11813.1 hypothetical protein BBH88_16925 [Planococcus antarcticus DSM 14505]
MREFSGFTGILYVLAEWIMRFFTVNILWFILNLPTVFLVASFFFSDPDVGIVTYLLPLVIFIPFLFVPTTIAMFATVREWILNTEQPSLTKAYLLHLKNSYKKSVGIGLALTGIWLIWLIDFQFFKSLNEMWGMVFLVFGCILFIYTVNLFSMSAHYQMKNTVLLKNAFFITVGNPVLSFFILASNLALFYVSITQLQFLLPFFTGALSTYLSFLVFYRFTLKVEEKTQATTSKEFDMK